MTREDTDVKSILMRLLRVVFLNFLRGWVLDVEASSAPLAKAMSLIFRLKEPETKIGSFKQVGGEAGSMLKSNFYTLAKMPLTWSVRLPKPTFLP